MVPHDELDPTERRSHPRILTPYRLAVRAGTPELEGFLMDLSREGLRVRFLAESQLTGVDRLRVELPAWLGMGATVELPGRFVWFRPGDGFRGPEGGFAFEALPEDGRQLVDDLMEGILRAAEEDGLLSHAMSEVLPAVGSSLF